MNRATFLDRRTEYWPRSWRAESAWFRASSEREVLYLRSRWAAAAAIVRGPASRALDHAPRPWTSFAAAPGTGTRLPEPRALAGQSRHYARMAGLVDSTTGALSRAAQATSASWTRQRQRPTLASESERLEAGMVKSLPPIRQGRSAAARRERSTLSADAYLPAGRVKVTIPLS